jgi:hypothetical protein
MRASLIAVAVAAVACSSPSIHGAATARSNAEPAGRVVADYGVRACRDARGAPAELSLSVHLVEFSPDAVALIVRRPGYDSLVVQNAFTQGHEWVFQAQSRASSGEPLLFDARLRAPDWQSGRLAYAREFRERRLERERFQAYFDRPVVACSLERK